MKSCYYIKLSKSALAIADLCDYYGKGQIITRINVPKAHRGVGVGSDLLNQITNDADKEGITLFLEISPSDGLQYDELEKWYLSHGFSHWMGIFKRKPRSIN